MKGIIDRFEENFAIVELDDMTMINIDRSKLPKEAKVGDCIEEVEGAFRINVDATNERRKIINDLMNKAFE